MAKYRKRPVVVEAEQFWPGREAELGVRRAQFDDHNVRYYIKTLEGLMSVEPGYWIVTGIQGEKYGVRPDIFVETYEPIES